MASSEGELVSSTTVARYTLVAVAVIAAALFVWQIKQMLLLAFAGMIMAVLITGMARGLRRILPLSRPWSLACVGLIVALAIGLFVLAFGPRISQEFSALTERLPEQISQLQANIQQQPWGGFLLDDGGSSQGGEGNASGSGGVSGGMLFSAASKLVDVLGTLVVILFVGIFFAASPDVYKRSITVLVPRDRVDRVDEALGASGDALWQWLTGQLIAMAFIGVVVTIGLIIVGVPLPFILGLIAALFNFVPFVGPIVSAVPALLLAFPEGTQAVLLTGLVFLIAQQIEGNIITPLIQRQKVSLPPAMVLLSVAGFGLVFGIPGVILATPLAVVAMVLIGMLYVQDVLHKDISIPARSKGEE